MALNQAVKQPSIGNGCHLKHTSLYICYQSLFAPLTRAQVIAYLEGAAKANNSIILLTYELRTPPVQEAEKWRQELALVGIHWQWLRYHKWPSLPATLWDVLVGILVSWRLIRRHRISIVHARSHVPALMGLVLKRLTNIKLLFDLRGLMAEEYVDAGVWKPGGFLFRLTKSAERRIIRAADAIVVLTKQAKQFLLESYPAETHSKTITVIPCCVDFYRTWGDHSSEAKGVPRLVYVGKLGGWYLDREMLDFFGTASRIDPNLQFDIWTQSATTSIETIIEDCQLDNVNIASVKPAHLPEKLQRATAAIAFIKPCISKRASSPTKIGEYLAAGLPVIANAGIGDLDELLQGNGEGPVGVLVKDFTDDSYRIALDQLAVLQQSPKIAERCQKVAREFLDLRTVGWPRYQQVYRDLVYHQNESASTR